MFQKESNKHNKMEIATRKTSKLLPYELGQNRHAFIKLHCKHMNIGLQSHEFPLQDEFRINSIN